MNIISSCINRISSPKGSSTKQLSNNVSIGSTGQGRLAPKFRPIFINGCNYTEGESRAAAEKISSLFEKTVGREIKVEYVHIPMTPTEVARSIKKKTDLSGTDELLTHIRKRLLKNDRVALFFHSGGGACVKNISEKLSESERGKLDIIGFGSPCLFDKKTFRSVTNVIAYGDPVPALGKFMDGSLFSKTPWPEVVPAGSRWQTPFASHTFLNKPYQTILEQIVKKFSSELVPTVPLSAV